MSRSATRFSSLALASVVSMRSCATRLAVSARNIALRWLVLRLNCRPALRCLIVRFLESLLALGLLRLPALQHPGPVVELHAETQAHGGQDLFDFFERLATKVLGLEHVLLGLLNQLADQGDVGVLQAVGRAHAQLELVHRTEQVL